MSQGGGNRQQRRAAASVGLTPPPPPPTTRQPGSSTPGGRGGGGGSGRGRQGSRGRFNGQAGRFSSPSGPSPGSHHKRAPGGGGSSGSRGTFASSRVFGRGPEAVEFESDGKGHEWKVGPPPGQRCQVPAFLRGLSLFVEFQQQQGQQAKGRLAPGITLAAACQGHSDIAATSTSLSTQFESAVEPASGLGPGDASDEEEEDTATSTAVPPPPPAVPPPLPPPPPAMPEAPSNGAPSPFAGVDPGVADAGGPAAAAAQAQHQQEQGDEAGSSAICTQELRPVLPGAGEDLTEAFSSSAAALESTAPSSATAPSRAWWSADEIALQHAASAASTACGSASGSGLTLAPVLLSLRLERMDLTDREVGMVADWAAAAAASGAAIVTKLWLFGNRVGDEGAKAVARILHPLLSEVHLSHNLLTLEGVACLLRALPSGPCRPTPLWLRVEWNRLSLEGLAAELQAQHDQRGLLVDVPEAERADAVPPLPQMPAYLRVAKSAAAVGGRGPGLARPGRNSLRFVLAKCHCRMPWVASQFERPAEAAVLRTAKATWQGSAAHASTPPPPPPPPPSSMTTTTTAAAASSAAVAAAVGLPSSTSAPSTGPLLLVPDTSALLPMIGASASMTTPTFFTLDLLAQLADRGLFGRALPATEQVFIIVPASVAIQLDALKTDPWARPAVRRFMGKGLDEMGPAGRSFLTVLGAHEGEGLLLEREAEVAGSRGADVGSRGQAVDHRIVEVALFFQQEILREIQKGRPISADTQGNSPTAAEEVSAALPVILLTGDNGQAALARAHGLPAVLLKDIASVETQVRQQILQPGAQFTATALRRLLRDAAVRGLGHVAARSLQQEFDGAVACLGAALEALGQAQGRLQSVRSAAAAAAEGASSLQQALEGVLATHEEEAAGQELLEALLRKMGELEGRLQSHHSASRVLQWSTG